MRDLREEAIKRVCPGVHVLLREGEDLPPELLELVAQEHVREKDLADHVDKVENLTGDKLYKVGAALGVLGVVVLGDEVDAVPAELLVHEAGDVGEPGGQQLHDTALGRLPQQPGDVEHTGLGRVGH